MLIVDYHLKLSKIRKCDSIVIQNYRVFHDLYDKNRTSTLPVKAFIRVKHRTDIFFRQTNPLLSRLLYCRCYLH